MTIDLSDAALREMARSILNGLAILKREDGLCSYPTETAQFTYERACFEVQRWLARLCDAQRNQDADLVGGFVDRVYIDGPSPGGTQLLRKFVKEIATAIRGEGR